MSFIKKHNKLIILVVAFVALLSFYLIREFIASRHIYNESYLNGEDYIMNPKTYGVNEYSPVNITEEQMVNIYLNDFKYNMFNDVNNAYSMLNEEYRNLKFGYIDNFVSYVNALDYNDVNLEKYSISDDKKIVTVYLSNTYKYIFKINSVMEYEVYLDDYTVEYR